MIPEMLFGGPNPRRLLLWSFLFVVLIHPVAHSSGFLFADLDQGAPSSANSHDCLLCRAVFETPEPLAAVMIVHEAGAELVRPLSARKATTQPLAAFGQRAPPLV